MEFNTVTYGFADGTYQVCNINEQVAFNEKGRRRSIGEISKIFEDTAHDMGAISFKF
jgi:hypothetical protein